jgi:hypothetical protein
VRPQRHTLRPASVVARCRAWTGPAPASQELGGVPISDKPRQRDQQESEHELAVPAATTINTKGGAPKIDQTSSTSMWGRRQRQRIDRVPDGEARSAATEDDAVDDHARAMLGG